MLIRPVIKFIKNVLLVSILVGMLSVLCIRETLGETIPDVLLAQADAYGKSEEAITNIAIEKYKSTINAMEPSDQRRIEVAFRIAHILISPLQKWEAPNIDEAMNIYISILNNPSLPENHFWKFEAVYYLAGCYARRHDERANALFIKIIETNPDELIFPFGYDKHYYKEAIRNSYQQNALGTIIGLQGGNSDLMSTMINLELLGRYSDNKAFKERLNEVLERYRAQVIDQIMNETIQEFEMR